MALQGTLETFALPDVLRLLASTKKTGCYHLSGDRGSGDLWLVEGRIVAGRATNVPPGAGPVDVVFELLRYRDGDFVFEADATTPDAGEPKEVEDTLQAAEELAAEWAELEAVVPSADAWIRLNPLLPGDEVTIRADRWIVLCAIGGGLSVGRLGEVLQLGEVAVARTVKDLVELGVVELGSAPVGAPASAPSPVSEPEPFGAGSFEPELSEPGVVETASFDEPVSSYSADDLIVDSDDVAPVIEFVPLGDPIADLGGEPEPLAAWDPSGLVIEEPSPAPAPTDDGDEADAAEIARQLANLSPKAAKAVAAAAKATTPEERERALAEVDESENINRDLLLKFLGSVGS